MQVNSDLGPIGAEVSGIDLAQPLSDASIENIRRAWLDHGVLVFRNQTLVPKAQSAFSGRFGEMDIYPFMKPLDDDGRSLMDSRCHHRALLNSRRAVGAPGGRVLASGTTRRSNRREQTTTCADQQ